MCVNDEICNNPNSKIVYYLLDYFKVEFVII